MGHALGHAVGHLRESFQDWLYDWGYTHNGEFDLDQSVDVGWKKAPLRRLLGLLWNCTDTLPGGGVLRFGGRQQGQHLRPSGEGDQARAGEKANHLTQRALQPDGLRGPVS